MEERRQKQMFVVAVCRFLAYSIAAPTKNLMTEPEKIRSKGRHMKKIIAFASVSLLAVFLASASWAGDMVTPRIALERFEVSHYDGFWLFDKSARPARGEAGEHGAPLAVSFIFLVENPNTRAISLKGMSFGAAFDGFDLMTVKSRDVFWLPPGKTVRVRMNGFITADGACEKISAQGQTLAERRLSAWEAVEALYGKVAAREARVEIRGGKAEFSDGSRSIVAPFSQDFPPTGPEEIKPAKDAEKPGEKARAVPKPVKPGK